jgi:hypothetical protein
VWRDLAPRQILDPPEHRLPRHLFLHVAGGAHLQGANLTDAHLRGAQLSDANLSDADLSGALNLIQGQLDEACGRDTKLPPGLTLNKPCRASSNSVYSPR